MFNFTQDGHIHTPFCPHGTKDPFERYIHQAIAKGFKSITFTEHAPLPEAFVDPTPDKDSAMRSELLPEYFDTLRHLKEQFRDEIEIRIGLEIDYIPGLEEETLALVKPYAPMIDEAILSQHFLLLDGMYWMVDYSADTFRELVERTGSFEQVLKTYYTSLENGLSHAWEKLHVARIGHIDLPIKYQKLYEWERKNVEREENQLLETIAKRGFGLDVNTAGLRKPDCGQCYGAAVVSKASKLSIPLTLGSDAHVADDVGADFETIRQKKATLL